MMFHGQVQSRVIIVFSCVLRSTDPDQSAIAIVYIIVCYSVVVRLLWPDLVALICTACGSIAFVLSHSHQIKCRLSGQ